MQLSEHLAAKRKKALLLKIAVLIPWIVALGFILLSATSSPS